MTGPEEPFEGKTGLWDQVTGPFEVPLPAYPDGSRVVELSFLKQFPSEAHSQALLGFMPTVREWTDVADIESIDIEIYWQAYHEIGSHPSKWDPQTRESADHSLPYLLSVALIDGGITLDSFLPERFLDPALRPFMQKIRVSENPEFTAGFRPPGASIVGAPKALITVRTVSGDELVREVTYAKGHPENPMSQAEIDAKFDAASADLVDDERRERIRQAWWNIPSAADVNDATTTMADEFAPTAARVSQANA